MVAGIRHPRMAPFPARPKMRASLLSSYLAAWPSFPVAWPSLPVVWLVACQAVAPDAAKAPAALRAPVDAEGSAATVFEYLAGRYDSDGDGIITEEEYNRPGGEFLRLDRVTDGVLTEADFALAGRRVRSLGPSESKRQRALHLLAWYFQDDDEIRSVNLAELQGAHRAYDGNGDGRVGRSEFEGVADQREIFGRRPAGKWAGLLEMETTDPWERILLGVDGNDDGFLTAVELEGFFGANPDGAWTVGADELSVPLESLEGKMAPDFTLSDPSGKESVTLSDFAGVQPVALIFGSYT